VNVLTTPDDRFENLPDFPFTPSYVLVPGGADASLRVHYIDVGPRNGLPVLLLHGEPSWCFGWRHVIAILQRAGLRVIAPDLIGFGRSDKPALRTEHTYSKHVAWMTSFIDALNLENVCLVCHDWGGLIGLRMVAERPSRYASVLATNTALPSGEVPMPDAFYFWLRRSQEIAQFPVGRIVRDACQAPLAPATIAAYDAPFPDESYKAGPRQLPVIVPLAPSDPEAQANQRAWHVLGRFTRPFLTLFGGADPFTREVELELTRRIPGAAHQPHRVLNGVGHFIQEDAPDELGRAVLTLARSPATARSPG